MPLIFIAGGARSGKSRTAIQIARTRARKPLLIAAAPGPDEDLAEQLSAQPGSVEVRVQPLCSARDLAAQIRREAPQHDCLILDSLTQWLGDWMREDGDSPQPAVDEVLAACLESASTIIVVATEVGCGVEPESDLARRFRDEAGRMSQRCAAIAEETYWMVFGCPLRVK